MGTLQRKRRVKCANGLFARETIRSNFARVSILIERHLAVFPKSFGFDFEIRPLVELLNYLDFVPIIAQTNHTSHQAWIVLGVSVFLRGIDPAAFSVPHERRNRLHVDQGNRQTASP